MRHKLTIEIESDLNTVVDYLIKHVYKEIIGKGEYIDERLESRSKVEDNWVIVNVGGIKGKYRWRNI
jgi:hypothetical protein